MSIELTRIDHVGIAVEDLELAAELYSRTLAIEPSHRERVEEQGVEEIFFDVGDSSIQLLGSLGAHTPVGRFLTTRGPGLHHIAYRVGHIELALDALRSQGLRLVDDHGRPGSRGTTIAFVHPYAMNGVLTELVQLRAGP